MARDRGLFAGGDDQDVNLAISSTDALVRTLVRGRVEADAEPLQPVADLLPDGATVLADAAGEDKTVQSAKRVRHHRDLSGDAKREEIDCFGRRSVAAGLQRAHVCGNAGYAEQSGFLIEQML